MAELSIEELLGTSADLMSTIPKVIPTYGGVSTAKVNKEVTRASNQRNESEQVVNDSVKRNEAATTAEKEAIGRRGDAEAAGEMAKQAREQEIADNVKAVNNMFGISTDLDAAIGEAATKNALVLKPSAEKQLREIQQMQSVGPFDNPLEWLYNGIQLPSKIQSYNTVATQINNNEDAIASGIKTASDMSTQLNRGVPTLTIAMAKASADTAKAKADKEKADADEAAARFNIDASNKKLSADLAIADATVKTTELDMRNAKAKYDSQIQAISIAVTNAERLLKAAQIRESISGLNAEKIVLSNAEEMLGYKKGSLSPEMVKKMKAEDRDNIYAIGASRTFGNNPMDALENIKRARPGDLFSKDATDMANYIQTTLGHINATVNNLEVGGQKDVMEMQRIKALPPAEKKAYYGGRLNDSIAIDAASAEKIGNIFHEFSPAKILIADPDFKESPVGKILAPLAVTDTDVTPKTIAMTLLQGVGNINDAGAAGAEYYRKNMQVRNGALHFKDFGISAPKGYPVNINGASFDLTKDADYTKYLLTLKIVNAQEAQEKQFRQPGNVIFGSH